MNQEDGRRRVIIEGVAPEIDGGRFPIKRILGDKVRVEADIFADGHDVLRAVLKYRHADDIAWAQETMEFIGNDRWAGVFLVPKVGIYLYELEGWIDAFSTWGRDLEKKLKAGLEVGIELSAGLEMVQAALAGAKAQQAQELQEVVNTLTAAKKSSDWTKLARALTPRIADVIDAHSQRQHVATYSRALRVRVDPVRAEFGAWFEMFPRSAAAQPGRHGTLKDCEGWLPRIAAMGFDVLYLPPVHPIGRTFRKGKNNSANPGPEDPGSPWAIGAKEGGHKTIHPQLGTLKDFRQLVTRARELKIEVALDIAFQCSPDHPYVHEHPDWFRKRPDGSIQYAENPPKKYQDIYPLDFQSEDWPELWRELKSIFEFWIDQGVRIFRVDNPHTKPFAFWEWCLEELKKSEPNLIFLAEAFTRPKVMAYLAKLGFTQSYNYFPWRNTKHELVSYLTELTQTEVREFFRPNLWPNTPDILTQFLQYGGRPAFMARLVLAATLGASYGIYGLPFILGEHQPRQTGSEEYLDSEKYEIRHWSLEGAPGLVDLVTKLNGIRRENPALQRNLNLQFHPVDNEQLIAYSKRAEDLEDIILTVVNLDPKHTQRGWVTLPLADWDLEPHATYQLHELITEARFLWSGERNYIELDPQFVPAHILRVRRHVRTEQDFDYFL